MGKQPRAGRGVRKDRPEGTYRAIGLMSGTSLDGIDIALVETDGIDRVVRGPHATIAYPSRFRALLRQAIDDARHLGDRTARPGALAAAEQELTSRHADAVIAFMGQHGLQPSAIDCIGFHGQTVLHADLASGIAGGAGRARKLTVQLGDGPGLAAATGIDVVFDLRAADVAAGGQGAPLVPVFHRALVSRLEDRPIAVVNVGGVANVTWIGADGRLIAFDTGPGNAMVDDWVHTLAGAEFDTDGRIAANGAIDEALLTGLLSHPYFAEPPPKSLDRNTFQLPTALRAMRPGAVLPSEAASNENQPPSRLGLEDGAATLTHFTARAIARSREHMPEEPRLWVICGGGRRNRTLMEAIASLVHGAVVPAEAVGLDGDSVEAEAWAYLAVRSLRNLPISFPGTTGVPHPLSGGLFAPAPD